MSFFGYLAAGAAEGVGKSMVSEADYADKLNVQRQLLQEKQAASLTAQRERAMDKQDQMMLQAELRGERGGGRGDGSFNLARELINAETTEKQKRLMEVARAMGGDDAAGNVGAIYGMQPASQRTPITPGDFARYDRQAQADGSNSAPVPVATTTPGSFDRQKGTVALNRVLAMAADPAKLKPYADGEAQLLRNDVTAGITLPNARRSGDLSTDNINEALTTLDAKAINQSGKNSTFADRTSVMRESEAGKAERAATGEEGRNYRAELSKAETAYIKALENKNKVGGKDRPKAEKEIADAKAYLDKARGKLTSSDAATAPTTKTRTPSQAAAAFKAGQSY